MKTDRNYAQFYALLKLMEGASKEDLVSTYTNGRTISLRQMSELEYRSMIGAMQRITTNRDALRKERSASLKLMQRLGVRTEDWSRVNSFCENPRIVGKVFAKITIPEHLALQRKLRAMLSKGSLQPDLAPQVILPAKGQMPS